MIEQAGQVFEPDLDGFPRGAEPPPEQGSSLIHLAPVAEEVGQGCGEIRVVRPCLKAAAED